MTNDTMTLLELLRNRLDGAEPDMLREMVQVMAEGLRGAEADALCGARYGARERPIAGLRTRPRQK